jgi:hypothetical protein
MVSKIIISYLGYGIAIYGFSEDHNLVLYHKTLL